MRPFERWSLRLGAGLTTATGVVYGGLRYFGGVHGEFGPEPSPWQSPWQHAHVLAAPLLVFALGLALAGHARSSVDGKVRRGRGRRSGLSLAFLGIPLVMGGYAIQVVLSAGARSWLGWLHSGLGGLFVVLYLTHWAKRWIRARKPGRAVTLRSPVANP